MLRVYPFRVISASQLKTAEYSPRKWYYEKILKLPYRRKGHFGFGTTLAECLERYLLADHTEGLEVCFPESYSPIDVFGRSETDHPVRWDWRLEKPTTEGPLIRHLVAEAIEKGFLRRSADAWVEWELPRVPFGGTAELMGWGDLAYPDENTILDHKSTKSARYIMSRPKMKRDIQLILYAAFLLDQKRDAGEEPEKITVGHIAYIKDGGVPYGERVQLKTAEVTPAEIDARMEEIHSLATDMHVWAETPPEDHCLVPCGGKSCMNMFGGCPYVTICGGEVSPLEYKNQFDKAASMMDTLSRRAKGETRPEGDAMANRLLDRLKSGKRPETAKQPAAPAVPAQPENTTGPAPWASESCPNCGGSGWTAKGDPCRICIGVTKFDMSTVKITGPFEFETLASEPQEPAQEPAPEKAPEAAEEPKAPESAPSAAEKPKNRLLAGLGSKRTPAAPEPDQNPMPHDFKEPAPEPEKAPEPAPQPEPEKAPEPAPAPKKGKGRGRGRPKVTTITLTIKTSDEALLERLTRIAEALGG